MAATTLTVYLVNKADDFNGLFDATHRAKAATILEGFFKDVIKLCAARYNAVDVKWDGKKGDPTVNDLVCYVLPSSGSSIVSGKGSVGSLGPSGTTVGRPSSTPCWSNSGRSLTMRSSRPGSSPEVSMRRADTRRI